MTRAVEAIGPDTSLVEAARFMRDESIGFLPVLEEGRLVGVITDRDITVRATADALDAQSTRVGSVMTKPVVTISESESIYEADALMERHTIRRLVVLDGRGALCGVLSLDDLAVLPDREKDSMVEP
ncbi:MAG: CBS domain-containing protein [Deltaproteobacteria bacterium]|nr:CBS domain-containing protein [Deltaproteobacteria bacterium]